MNNKELNTEQTILEVAEAEFLEKGFGNTKMMAIAKRAGVSHSMLHYYFRSKENLFQMIFRKKIRILSEIFEGMSSGHISFFEMIRIFMEYQFDFIAQNPRLPHFVLNEIMAKKDNLEMLLEVVAPKISVILSFIEQALNKEIERKTVRPVLFRDLIMNIISINISTFIFLPVMGNILPDVDENTKQTFLKERRENNILFILNSLRP